MIYNARKYFNGENMNRWISVEHGIPESDVDVLDFDETTGQQYVARISLGGWAILSGLHVISDLYDCQPTHWMPLPNPPTQQENERHGGE